MKRNARGFTMLEVMIAVSMGLVLTIIAVPMTVNTISSFNLRLTANGLANGMQMARMRAVNLDKSCRLRSVVSNGRTFVYIDENNNSSLDDDEEKVVLTLPRKITIDSSGPTISLGGTQVYTLPGFTTRGMPCNPTSTCASSPGNFFYVFLKQDRLLTQTAWAAVSVSPAGRMQVWTWNGTAWQ